MRDDDLGMFWNDFPADKAGRSRAPRPMPPIPDTGWQVPREFPNLSGARCIALDTETKEPDFDRGPGWARGLGHIVGVSLAVHDAAWYLPVRHEVEPENNLPVQNVMDYLRDVLSNPHQAKVGANLLYDLGWLSEEGIEVAGELMDVQHAEALLDERSEVNVDALGRKYLGFGKEDSLLYRWLADFYGGAANDKQRANIYRAPARLVGPYAERDAVVPLRVAAAQYPQLEREGLLDLLRVENKLIRLLLAMRRAGVSVNVDRAEALRTKLLALEQEAQARLDSVAGFHVEVGKSGSLARAFDALGYDYPRTAPTERNPEGRPSFVKEWLAAQHTPLAKQVMEVRKLSKLRGTFIESYVLNSHVDGKLHGQFHLLRSDANGARSGRLSSSTPNLQNIPSRDEELAPLVRGIFIPDAGHKQWRRYDYSQIEYRLLVHFATGPGSHEVQEQYRNDPTTDYHEFVRHMIRTMTGYELERKPAKNINFGLIYGMGIPKLLRTLGLTKAEGKKLFDAYHAAVPYAKTAMEECSGLVDRDGYITTILGRRSRFDLWESGERREHGIALPYEQAIRRYPSVRRAHTHKALNRRLQGSAADIMKLAMLKCWEDGVFDVTGVPRLTVHDELDFSDPGGCDEAFEHCRHILETAVPLRIPVRAEPEVGPDWGAVE